ncbi:restriction endonuclease [Streptomyces sp. NPDC021622]|uniref:restriction endonuclease n=1 Tax=Streptomyces sp. NPDC021622 TaxID=3155013 RepID=UPI0033FAAC01
MDLEQTLEQFDAVDANLRRLETVWTELRQMVPDGIVFAGGGPDGRRYQDLSRAYEQILTGLPPIGDYQITSVPDSLNTIAQNRLDAQEIGFADAFVSVEESIDQPGTEIDEYRFLLNQSRRELVRERVLQLVGQINSLLAELKGRIPTDNQPISDDGWRSFVLAFTEVERLAGSSVPRKARWDYLRRHVSWGQGQDLHDIASMDWPSVLKEIQESLYSELEPLPVHVDNLASLVAAKPTGPVTTKLKWSAISADDFERLLFNLVADANDYTNPQWLMRTNAPDRGRDISVQRVAVDTLSGTKNQRVIIQAKHWQSKSVAVADISEATAQMRLWEPPSVHALVFATSGRFTADAVAWVEKHNENSESPHIEMWPDSHLELLLASRPHLVAEFRLR